MVVTRLSRRKFVAASVATGALGPTFFINALLAQDGQAPIADILGEFAVKAREEETRRYKECGSPIVKRAYEYSAEIARLGYILIPNLAMQLELILAIKSDDLLDENAIFLYQRSVETLFFSFTWHNRAASDRISAQHKSLAAKQLHSHINRMTESQPLLKKNLSPIEDALRQLAHPPRAPDFEVWKKEVGELDAADLVETGVDQQTAVAWIKELSELKDELTELNRIVAEFNKNAAKGAPRLEDGENIQNVPRPEEKLKKVVEKFGKFIASKGTQDVLKGFLGKKAGAKAAGKLLKIAGAFLSVAITAIDIFSKWGELGDGAKISSMVRLAMELALAIQVFLSAATAGIKTGILLLLLLLLDFIDIGLNLFPNGEGPVKGDNGEPPKGGSGLPLPEPTKKEKRGAAGGKKQEPAKLAEGTATVDEPALTNDQTKAQQGANSGTETEKNKMSDEITMIKAQIAKAPDADKPGLEKKLSELESASNYLTRALLGTTPGSVVKDFAAHVQEKEKKENATLTDAAKVEEYIKLHKHGYLVTNADNSIVAQAVSKMFPRETSRNSGSRPSQPPQR